MDVNSIFNNKGIIIKNPNYDPKKKKNLEPPTILTSDVTKGENPLVTLGYEGNIRHGKVYTDTDRYNQLIEYGVTPNDVDERRIGSYENQLANNQSAAEKWWNAAKQAVWSEIAVGTVKGFSDIADYIGSKITKQDDYSNPLSQALEEYQERFKQENPIFDSYHPSDENYFARIKGAGWWASNMPSIASTITLMIPARTATGLLSLAGKAANVGRYTRAGMRAVTGVNKLRKAGKGFKDMSNLQRVLNSTKNFELAGRVAEDVTGGILMRTAENYQEARQSYNEVYKVAAEQFNKMDDAEFDEWKQKHSDFVNTLSADKQDKDNVAREIAKQSADKTFAMDWANVVFDIWQLHNLKNPLRMLKSARTTSTLAKANREAIGNTMRAAGMSEEAIAKKMGNKYVNAIKDRFMAPVGVLSSEWTEGVEEGVNYVAQQEGINYGNLILGKAEPSTFDKRWHSYYHNPEFWDSFIWGVLGGVGFHAAGSAVQRGQQLIYSYGDNKTDEKTKEKVDKGFFDRFMLPETKFRLKEIEHRQAAVTSLKDKLSSLRDGKNPYDTSGNGTVEKGGLEQQVLMDKAINEFVAETTFNALATGNYDMLRTYLADEQVQEAFKEMGITEGDTNAFVQELLGKMDNISETYDKEATLLDALAATLDPKTIGSGVPIEYIQMLARENARYDLNIDEAQRRLEGYLEEANRIEEAAKQDDTIPSFADGLISNRDAANMVTLTSYLGHLYSERRSILADKDLAESITGKIRLTSINNQIEATNTALKQMSGEVGSNRQLATMLYTMGTALKFTKDAAGNLIDTNTDDYVKFLDAIMTRDAKTINATLSELNVFGKGKSFELTDENVTSLFGVKGEVGTGIYDQLANDINSILNSKDGLQKTNKPLYDAYMQAAAAEVEKINNESQKVTNIDQLRTEIAMLHNTQNEVRVEAIEKSRDIIINFADKYDALDVLNYIRDNELPNNVTAEDKKNLDDALEVLNLTNESNFGILHALEELLVRHSLVKEAKAKNKQAAETANEGDKIDQTDDTTSEGSEAATMQGNGQESSVDNSITLYDSRPNVSLNTTTDDASPNGLALGNASDTDSHIGTISLESNDDISNGVTYTVTSDIDSLSGVAKNKLYDTDNGEPINDNEKYTVETAPVISLDDNDNITIINKGVIRKAEAKPSNTSIPSTGGVESTPEAAATSAPESSSKTSPAKGTDADSERIAAQAYDSFLERQGNITRRINELFVEHRTTANSLTEALDEVERIIKEEYPEDDDIKLINKIIGAYRNRIAKINGTPTNALASAVGEVIIEQGPVLLSNVGEDFNRKLERFGNFVTAVDNLLVECLNKVNTNFVNVTDEEGNVVGKKLLVNLESVLRYISATYGNDTLVSKMVYDSIKNYLQTDVAQQKYLVVDSSLTDAVSNLDKSVNQRIKEVVGLTETFSNKIDILDVIARQHEALKNNDAAAKAYFEALNKLKPGDKLHVRIADNNVIELTTDDGIVIGIMPAATNDGSSYHMINEGWTYSIPTSVGNASNSPLRGIFQHWLLDEGHNDFNSAIFELAFSKNLTKKQRNALIKKIYDSNEIQSIKKDYIDSEVSPEIVVNHLVKLYRAISSIGGGIFTIKDNTGFVNDTLNKWFDKLQADYIAVEQLVDSAKDTDTTLTVSAVHSGEIIENEGKSEDDYNKFRFAKNAIADKENTTIAVETDNDVIGIDGRKYPRTTSARSGQIFCMIDNANGTNGYIKAVTTKLNDLGGLTPVFRQYTKDVIEEVKEYIRKEINADNIAKLFDMLLTTNGRGINNYSLFYDSSNPAHKKISIVNSKGTIYVNLKYGKDNKSTHHIKITTDKTGKHVFILNGGTKHISLNELRNNAEELNSFLNVIQEAFDQCSFSIPFGLILQTNFQVGAFNKTQDSFSISIPKANSKEKLTFTDNEGLNHFMLNHGALKVNTRIVDGSNWAHTPTRNPYATQKVEVEMQRVAKPPVEEYEDNTSAIDATTDEGIVSAVNAVINNNRIKNKGERIISDLFSDSLINGKSGKAIIAGLKALSTAKINLIPKNVVYDENLPIDKEATYSKGVVTIGKKWVEIAKSNPSRAIRILVHEQIHDNIANLSNADRETLYKSIANIRNKFSEWLDKNPDRKAELDKFLFTGKDARVQLEEFITESLTNIQLINALNEIDGDKVNGKTQTLWQKIINKLAELFGWNVREGSLYEQELKTLGTNLNAKETITPSNTTQTELNFDEESSNETPETEPETQPQTEQETEQEETVEDVELNEFDEDDTYVGNFDDVEVEDEDDEEVNSSAGEIIINPNEISNDMIKSSSPMGAISRQSIPDRLAVAASIARGDISISCR